MADTEDDDDCTCPHCVALDLLEMAVVNCDAAGVHPQRVYDRVIEMLGLYEEDDGDADAGLRAAVPAGRG